MSTRGSYLMDPNTEKHVDQLYRNSKQMVAASALGVLVPIVLVIAAPLGLLYAYQRSRLLGRIATGKLDVPNDSLSGSDPPSLSDKIAYLRAHPLRFFAPFLVLGAAVLFVAIIALSQG